MMKYALCLILVALVIAPFALAQETTVDRYLLIRVGYRVPPGKQKKSTDSRHVGDVLVVRSPDHLFWYFTDRERTENIVIKLVNIPADQVDTISDLLVEEVLPMRTWGGGEYYLGDEVQHEGVAYRCIVDLTETEPPSDDWLDIGDPPTPVYRAIGFFNGQYNEGQIVNWLKKEDPNLADFFDTYWNDTTLEPVSEIPDIEWSFAETRFWRKIAEAWTTSAYWQ